MSLRLDLKARDALYFPPGKAANILLAAFGIALRRGATEAEYEHIFEPRGGAGPSGLADRPRPFVFRAPVEFFGSAVPQSSIAVERRELAP